jgi:hypothetical protein
VDVRQEMVSRLLLSIGVGLMFGQVSAPPDNDVRVYQAVLAHTIRSAVDRFSSGASLKTPAPVLAFDRTLLICRAESDHPRQMGCIRTEEIQSFEAKGPRMGTLMFEGRLTAEAREELGKSFRERK